MTLDWIAALLRMARQAASHNVRAKPNEKNMRFCGTDPFPVSVIVGKNLPRFSELVKPDFFPTFICRKSPIDREAFWVALAPFI